jgi:urease accessory protein
MGIGMRRRTVIPLSAILLLVASYPAAAHHVMEGKTPSTFVEGLLSGLGHPIIGIDHLAFLAAIGIAVGFARLNLAMPLVFVVASALGVGLHVQGFNVPAVETAIAASVLLAGALVARGRILPSFVWFLLFALAGVIHGYAYGESIVGAELAPLWAYLAGLIIIQTLLATGIAMLTRNIANPVTPRLAGAVVAGIGLAVLAGRVLPA